MLPPPQSAVCQKLLVCCGCVLYFRVVTLSLPIRLNVEPDFVSQKSFLVRLTYAFFSVQAARPKFYFAWMLGELRVWENPGLSQEFIMTNTCVSPLPPSVASADAVNNAAGYGFSGMDENGQASWDLIGNLNILGIEVIITSFSGGFWITMLIFNEIIVHFFPRLRPISRRSSTTGTSKLQFGSKRQC